MKRILHVAVENYAGVPYDFSQMHNQCGDYSRLITQYNNIRGFKEDITLNFTIPRSTLASAWRQKNVLIFIENNKTMLRLLNQRTLWSHGIFD